MYDSPDEAVPEASPAAASPPDRNGLGIRARAADAILGPVPFKKSEDGSVRTVPPLFKRLLSYGPYAALAACLFGFAWVGGSYFSGGQSPFYAMKPRPVGTVAPQDSVERAEMVRTVQKMAEEIRALKANAEAVHAAQSLSAKDATGLEGLKTRLDAVKTETGAAIAELAGKVEHLQRDSAAKLSQVSERFDRIEHEIASPLATALLGAASSSKEATARKRIQGGRGDAFDPSQNPTAPGAPRPLGSLAPAASTNNPAGESAYGQRNN
jgi:hypothetical protein